MAHPPPQPGASEAADQGHGAVTGAAEVAEVAEVAEPQLHLVAVDTAGKASMLDLLKGTPSASEPVAPPAHVASDGRYVFAAHANGVDILDTGVWTWNHGDYSHYYRAEPTTIGTISEDGPAPVATGLLSIAGGTGLFFPTSGTAVLLDNAALAAGTIAESLRLDVAPHAGIIAPLGEGAVVTEADAAGTPSRLRAVDAGGKELTTAQCPAAAGTITTSVGLVIGCADGAVIATSNGATPLLTHVPYPSGPPRPDHSTDARAGPPSPASARMPACGY